MNNFTRIKDGINLGSLTTDPISGMLKGDIYFNTSTNTLRQYNGTTWENVATENSAANRALSNLTNPTSVNQALLPATDATLDLGGPNNTWRREYAQEIRAPQHTGFGGNAGQPSGNVLFGSRAPSDNTQNSGDVTVSSSVTAFGSSGALTLSTGNSAAANSGTITINTGDAIGGGAGNINLVAGQGSSTRGQITIVADSFNAGSVPIINVPNPINPQDAATKFYVDAADATFANKTLSNLDSPTAINQHLLPDIDNNRNLGDPSNRFGITYSQSVVTDFVFDNFIIQAVDVSNRKLISNTNAEKIVWSNDDVSIKGIGNGSIILQPSGIGNVNVTGFPITNVADPTSAQDAATKNYVDTNFIPTTEKGVALGVATLDGAGKVPVTQLPASIMTYEGVWDASTNTPTLADGTGSAGMVYRVSVAGTQDLGSGPITFDVGDYVIYNGTVWEKSDTTDSVVSVNGLTGIVSLDTDDIPEGTTNLYFTDARAQAAVDLSGYLKRDGSNSITGSLLPDISGTRNFGTNLARFGSVFASNVDSSLTTNRDLSNNIISSNTYSQQTVGASTSSVVVSKTTKGYIVEYLLKVNTSNKYRIGRLLVVTDGTTTSITDSNTTPNTIAVSFTAALNAGSLETTLVNSEANTIDIKLEIKAMDL